MMSSKKLYNLEYNFDIVEIESNYLRDLLTTVLFKIIESTGKDEIDFGWVREGPTFSGEAGEVTEDGAIILDSNILREYNNDVTMAIIAHELAHFYLGHYSSWPDGLEFENEADELAKSWGFNIDKFREVCGPAATIR